MVTNDDLAALGNMMEIARDRLAERMARGEIAETEARRDPSGCFGVTHGALDRGVLAYARTVYHPSEEGGIIFAMVHAWGEAEAMRRVKVAVSDPRARGRELGVVAALEGGASIEAALTPPERPQEDCGVVIQLRRPE